MYNCYKLQAFVEPLGTVRYTFGSSITDNNDNNMTLRNY